MIIKVLFLLNGQHVTAQHTKLKFKVLSFYKGKEYLSNFKIIIDKNPKFDILFYKERFAKFYKIPNILAQKKYKTQKITS